MAMSYMIWQEMSMNGVRIAMMRTIIVLHQLRTLQGLVEAKNECCGAVLGTILPPTCGWLLASTTLRFLGSTSMDFDVCQDRINYLFVFIDLLLEESDLEKVYGLVINRLVQLD